MQARTLLEKTQCPEPIFKEWLKRHVVIPLRPGQGPGVHAEYDDANAVALMVALRMKEAAIIVTKYAEAFTVFHEWLRGHSALEWARQIAVFSPADIAFIPASQWARTTVESGFVASLGPICAQLSWSNPLSPDRQIPLLGLEAVGGRL